MSDNSERPIVRRRLDTDAPEPAAEVAEAVADIEDVETTELPNMWACTDNVLDHLFSDPPSPDAQMRVMFNYDGYRISVDQDGSAEFRELS